MSFVDDPARRLEEMRLALDQAAIGHDGSARHHHVRQRQVLPISEFRAKSYRQDHRIINLAITRRSIFASCGGRLLRGRWRGAASEGRHDLLGRYDHRRF
jgi:hypothetical protein